MDNYFTKERSVSAYLDQDDYLSRYVNATVDRHRQTLVQKDSEREKQRQGEEREKQQQELRDRETGREIARERQRERQKSEGSDGRQNNSVGLVIGNQLANLDPVCRFNFKNKT